MRPRRAIFKVAFWITLPILQTGADLASLYRRFPSWRPVIFLLWLPVRGLGKLTYYTTKWIGEESV